MADFTDNLFRVAQDSDTVRIKPGALVQLYAAGTATLIGEAQSNSDGQYTITDIPIGSYNVKVDGRTIKTVEFVPADHIHKPVETWLFHDFGAITADRDEDQQHPVFAVPAVPGQIVEIRVVAERAANNGDVTVHLLRGSSAGAALLAFATDTVWNHRIQNTSGSTIYRYVYSDDDPGLAVAAGEAVTTAIDHHANGVEGITVLVLFRPD